MKKPQTDINNGCLAGARGADNTDGPSNRKSDVCIIEDQRIRVRIPVGDVLHLDGFLYRKLFDRDLLFIILRAV